jgi:hypothetical protein
LRISPLTDPWNATSAPASITRSPLSRTDYDELDRKACEIIEAYRQERDAEVEVEVNGTTTAGSGPWPSSSRLAKARSVTASAARR